MILGSWLTELQMYRLLGQMAGDTRELLERFAGVSTNV